MSREFRTNLYNPTLIDAIAAISRTHWCSSAVNASRPGKDLNGELVIHCESWRSRRFNKAALAYGIKAYIRGTYGSNYEKGSNNNVHINFKFDRWSDLKEYRDRTIDIEIPVNYLWIAYDILLGHKTDRLIKFYGNNVINDAIGEPLNPMEVEQEKLRLEEVEKISAEYTEKIKEARAKTDEKMAEIKKEHDKIIDQLNNERDAKIKEITEQFNELRKAMKFAI